MNLQVQRLVFATVMILGFAALAAALFPDTSSAQGPGPVELQTQGKEVFRFDTFGDEQLWTDALGLHKVVEKSVLPATALKSGLKAEVDANNHITRLGVTCALCHSTVDDSVMPGSSLDVGKIISLSPALTAE
jgi:hypothetical protein